MISQLAQAIGSTGCLGSASLMHGVIPVAVAVITVVALLYAVGRRWRSRLLPIAAAIGVATGVGVHWFYGTLGLASEPPPRQMWAWVSLTGFSGAVAVAGWRSAGWWRRNASVFATSFCLLSTGLTINGWLGYFPSVYAAWGQLTNAPLPNQSDWRTVDDMRSKSIAPQHGIVVAVDTGNNASGFRHRTEWVYLPPTWFTAKRPTRLPAVLMIGGEFNTPPDWIRAGDAVTALDEFAAAHGGNAPIAVFADATGGFTIDTECVNGPRGNAADHLTADVIPMINAISGSHEPPLWGVVDSPPARHAPSISPSCTQTPSVPLSISAATSRPTRATELRLSTDCSAEMPPNGRHSTPAPSSADTATTPICPACSPFPEPSVAQPPNHCATSANTTASIAEWWHCPAAMTGPPPHRHSRPRCHGSPADCTRPVSQRPACRSRTSTSTRSLLGAEDSQASGPMPGGGRTAVLHPAAAILVAIRAAPPLTRRLLRPAAPVATWRVDCPRPGRAGVLESPGRRM